MRKGTCIVYQPVTGTTSTDMRRGDHPTVLQILTALIPIKHENFTLRSRRKGIQELSTITMNFYY